MSFDNYQSTENAESTFDASASASVTTIIVNPGEGALFPTVYPFLLTFEKFNTNSQIVGREIVKVTGSPATDQFTVVRQFSECVQDETVNPKVLSNGPQVFDSGDKISLYKTALDDKNQKEEITRLETAKLNITDYQNSTKVYGASSTGDDDYEVNITGITVYTDGMTLRIKADVSNTGACTLDVNGLGVKSVKKLQGTADLEDGDWSAGGIATCVYNTTLGLFQYSGQEAVAVGGGAEATQTVVIAGENITIGDAIAWDITLGFVKCNWNISNRRNYVGTANETVTSGNSFTLNQGGVDGNQSGLTVGQHLYTDLTNGSLTQTFVGHYNQTLVGTAISSTKFIMLEQKSITSTSILIISSGGSYVIPHNLGRIPKRINTYSHWRNNTQRSFGILDGGSQSCVELSSNNINAVTDDYIAKILNTYISVISMTSTTVTIDVNYHVETQITLLIQ